MTPSNERNIEKKDNSFSVDVKEGEKVRLFVGDECVIDLNIPYDAIINSYLKRAGTFPVQYNSI